MAALPPEARPRERLQRYGPGPLSEERPLALMIGADRTGRSHPPDPQKCATPSAPALAYLPHEEFHVLLLNSRNAPLCQRQVTRGILEVSPIHPRDIFRDALVLS